MRRFADSVRGAVLPTVIVVCAVCLLVPGAALAGTLDQEQTDGSGPGTVVTAFGPQSLAQSFTAGASGRLDQVDLYLGWDATPTAPLTVEIRDMSAGVPDMVLASESIPASSVPGALAFVPIIFGTPASVVAGTQYAIVAYTASTDYYIWPEGAGVDPYAGGLAFYDQTSIPPSTWRPDSVGDDLAFKTYVAPPTTDAPPTDTPMTVGASAPTATGQRAAAHKTCKKKHAHKAHKRCNKKANRLPV
jgi:hypothetical protein